MKQNHEQNHRYCVYLGSLKECSCSDCSGIVAVLTVGSKRIQNEFKEIPKSNFGKRRLGRAATVGSKIKLQQKAVHGMD